MAVVHNTTVGGAGTGITITGAGINSSGTWQTNALWSPPKIEINPHLVKADMLMDVFRRDAGFKDMADMYDTYASMAKLQNKTIDTLLVENFNRWKEETNYEY